MAMSGAALRAVFATTLAWILTLLFGSSAMAARHRIIFDTDSAYFLDDGAALVMLLHRQDLVEIGGVTVVSGNLWARQGAVYMLHLLEVTGNDEIPLYIGAHRSLSNSAERAREQAEHHGGLSYLGVFGQPELKSDDDRRRSWGFAANPNSSSFIWDCLAAGYLLDPGFVISEETLQVDVDVTFGASYGATFEPEDGGPQGLLPTRWP